MKMWNLKQKNYNTGQLLSSKVKSQLIKHNEKYYVNNPEKKPFKYIKYRILVLW
jgi:hypothetical protein